MKSFVKIGALLLLGAAFAGGMASCSDEYPKPVTPPTIVVKHNISGIVSDRSGAPIAGATIKLNKDNIEVVTDAQGFFVFPDVKVGDYKLDASAQGKLPASTNVAITNDASGMNAVWNVMLIDESAAKDIKFNTTVGTTVEDAMETGNIKGNDNGNVDVNVEVPADAFDGVSENQEITITITPIYDEEQAVSKAAERTMLVGAYLTCSDPNVKLKEGQTITITFDLDAQAVAALEAEKYGSNNAFAPYSKFTKDGATFKVHADELNTTYGLFADVNFVETPSTRALTFNPSVVDNLNGNSAVNIGNSNYNYGVGTSVEVSANYAKLRALLAEAIARRYGAAAIASVAGAYPVDVTLPIGCKFTIAGHQEINAISASCAGSQANATSFGDVMIQTNITTTADHNGGSI